MTKIMHRVMMPPPPTPDRTLPRMNTAKLGATAVIKAPAAKHADDNKIMAAGEKIMASLPAKGATEDMLIM